MAPSLEIRVLGELEVLRDGKAVALPASKKTRALLGYLVLAGSRPQPRQRLCDLLWDGPSDPRAAPPPASTARSYRAARASIERPLATISARRPLLRSTPRSAVRSTEARSRSRSRSKFFAGPPRCSEASCS